MITMLASVRYRGIKLALACVLALLGGFAFMPPPAYATGYCVSAGTPCIEFQLTNGFLGGPAGTRVDVIGGGFGSADGKTISLGVVKGDDILGSTPPPSATFCSQAHVNTGATAVVNSSGQFTASFKWPAGTSVGDWSVCAYLPATNMPATTDGNTDNWAFKVYSPYPPTVSVSPSTVAPGGSVSVTGKGWLPAENTIVVSIATCEGCTPIARYGNAASDSSGRFSVSLKIPASAKLGKYLVWAYSSAVPVATSSSGPHLTVGFLSPTPTAAPRPTATAPATITPAVSATPVPEATATPASVGAVGSNNQTGSGNGSGLFLGLVALAALVGIAGSAIYFVRRRRTVGGAAAASTSPGAQPGAPNHPNNPTEPRIPSL